ncbi:MAG: DUF4236 domain-containing protein [Alphaproteobacteria bacterium]|nr:DUF4236 domain-containing protein [Alphaproteobacteria bacterium]
MGFRFRKSVNFGGFRVNLSKTGIGYSFGFPGFRWTRLANGRSRRTASIPGTGLAYITESSGTRKTHPKQNIEKESSIPGQYLAKTTQISPEDYEPTDGKEFLAALRHYKNMQILWKTLLGVSVIVGFIYPFCLLGVLLFFGLSIYWYFSKRVIVTFCFDDETAKENHKIFESMFELLSNNERIYECAKTYHNSNTKYTSGASTTITTHRMTLKKTKPLFMKTNMLCFKMKTTFKELLFLPNGILINTPFSLYFLNMKDIAINWKTTIFIEDFTPRDSECVRTTWRYVNKKGGPDKRFNNNTQLYENRYGEVSFIIPEALDLSILFSNYKIVPTLQEYSDAIGFEYFKPEK